MSSLHRTQSKGFQLSGLINKGTDFYKLQYKTDGTGRDSYIQLNNGGLNTRYYSPSKQISTGSQMYVGNSQHGPGHDVHVDLTKGKIQNYEQNGTGRDTYIFDLNGGFYPQKTIASYTHNYRDQLRVSHKKEPTQDYMARRNSRMRKFNRNRISNLDKIVKNGRVDSPESQERKVTLVNRIRQGSKNYPIKVNSGWVTNKGFNEQRSQKELYQTIHASFLSLPRERKEKFEDGITNSAKLLRIDKSSSPKKFKSGFSQMQMHKSNVELKIQTGMGEVKKRQSSIHQDSDTKLQRRTSMTSNEMAKDMHKGDFEDSLKLLDNNFFTQLTANPPSAYQRTIGLKSNNALINRRMRKQLTSAQTPVMKKNDWRQHLYRGRNDYGQQEQQQPAYNGSIEYL